MSFSAIAGWLSIHAADLIDMIGLLIDSAIKGSLLVGAAAIASYVLRRQSAAARHAAWTAAVVGHLALPALTLLAPAWRLPFLPTPPWLSAAVEVPVVKTTTSASPITSTSTNASSPGAASTNPQSTTPAVTEKPRSAAQPVATASPRLNRFSVFAALWILGSVLVLLRLVVGTMQVGRLARYGARVMDGEWLSLAQRVAVALGITRPLTLLHGDRLGIPVTWGIVYPAVLLPADSSEWPEERRRFVLVHEMAHIKRFDALTQLLAQFALAVFWFDPLIWLAAHRMRVEREHACDDYVLREGTKPSLYAGELLDMVRSLGTPAHEAAAPAFAALAMARRSEFEGRMLAILDPRVDRDTLGRRSAAATFAAVALMVIPLAALRPFEQPLRTASTANTSKAIAATSSSSATSYSCDAVDMSKHATSTHISVNVDDEKSIFNLSYMQSTMGRCTEATMNGKPRLSRDEHEVLALTSDGVARVRERVPGSDRSVLITPSSDGGVSYTARMDGRLVAFDAPMQQWLARMIPEVMREAAVDVPQRVARLRARGGVNAVLSTIAEIRSTAAKTAHYQALLKTDDFTQSEIDEIARDAARDLASSPSDLRLVLETVLPQQSRASANRRNRYASQAAQQSIAQSIQKAVDATTSSSDKASLLTQYAVGGDPEAVLLALQGARDLTSDTDRMTLLTTLVANALTTSRSDLRKAFFDAVHVMSSDTNRATVLTAATPYGHANREVTLEVIRATGDMDSSTSQAEVLIAVAQQRLLTTAVARDAFLNAAKKLSSSSDYRRVLEAAAGQ